MGKNHNQKVRNVRAFVASYLKSDAGKSALNRKPIRVRGEDGQYKHIFRSSQMAEAFQQALA
jgi:hypothetical protein